MSTDTFIHKMDSYGCKTVIKFVFTFFCCFVEKPEDICGLAEVRGSCRAMLTRFRYDSKLKKCIMFHFGGCDSNGNNFVSEDKCNEFCRGQ